jgi:hypothetical protein
MLNPSPEGTGTAPCFVHWVPPVYKILCIYIYIVICIDIIIFKKNCTNFFIQSFMVVVLNKISTMKYKLSSDFETE